ncbi:hypothetical protein [Streptomyces chryseus]|uniref:hypothetical protein n=1 Tax=Streptomyces chryseus TaxID=68186 RepID=UPI00110FAC4B|nr:hypothetical protein [Streptomyces chryseus]GGX36403.1 hypothetical protein GCM10010353_59320 [Streptomyces chryseus]
MDIVEIDNPNDSVQRASGSYFVSRYGLMSFPDGVSADAVIRERGMTLWLMEGGRRLAQWEQTGSRDDMTELRDRAAEQIAPWVRTLRVLAPLSDLRAELETVRRLQLDLERYDDPSDVVDALVPHAATDEIEQARRDSRAFEPLGSPLAAIVVARLSEAITHTQRVALAAAPSPTAADLSAAWSVPAATWHGQPEPLGRMLARELLAGWASTVSLRDPLVSWAVAQNVAKAHVHELTGIARTTINRIA